MRNSRNCIGVIGVGVMGEALVAGLINSGSARLQFALQISVSNVSVNSKINTELHHQPSRILQQIVMPFY